MMAIEKNIITKKLLCDRKKVDGWTYKAYKSLNGAAESLFWKNIDIRKEHNTPQSDYIEVHLVIGTQTKS